MRLKTISNQYISFNDGNNKTYTLLTNTQENKLDILKLAISFLHLEKDTVITDAFDYSGKNLPDMYGVYIDEDKLNAQPQLFDKFFNVVFAIEEELKDMSQDIEYK